MPLRHHICINVTGKSQYQEPKRMTPATKREHKKCMLQHINVAAIPTDWDKFKELSNSEQLEMAKHILIAVGLFDLDRLDFIQGVLQEYEWVLADFWDYTCDNCGLPIEYCKS